MRQHFSVVIVSLLCNYLLTLIRYVGEEGDINTDFNIILQLTYNMDDGNISNDWGCSTHVTCYVYSLFETTFCMGFVLKLITHLL
jgi:hypothetical protein